jgi:hypothetical protein
VTCFITRRDAAALLCLSTKTLANWAAAGVGPRAYNPTGGRALYDTAEVVAWAKGQPGPAQVAAEPAKRGRGLPRKHPA